MASELLLNERRGHLLNVHRGDSVTLVGDFEGMVHRVRGVGAESVFTACSCQVHIVTVVEAPVSCLECIARGV